MRTEIEADREEEEVFLEVETLRRVNEELRKHPISREDPFKRAVEVNKLYERMAREVLEEARQNGKKVMHIV